MREKPRLDKRALKGQLINKRGQITTFMSTKNIDYRKLYTFYIDQSVVWLYS